MDSIRQGCWSKHHPSCPSIASVVVPGADLTLVWLRPTYGAGQFSLQPGAAARQERPEPSNSTQSFHCQVEIGDWVRWIFLFFLGSLGRTHERLPCGLQWRKLVELFKKRDSRFYCYDFKLRGKQHRSSTQETNKKRAEKVAA